MFNPGWSRGPSPDGAVFCRIDPARGRERGARLLIFLHKQATSTPKIRAAIQASSEPAWTVAERYGITEQTAWNWCNRDSAHDRSHTPHRLRTVLKELHMKTNYF